MNDRDIGAFIKANATFIGTNIGETRVLLCLRCGALISTASDAIPELHEIWHQQVGR